LNGFIPHSEFRITNEEEVVMITERQREIYEFIKAAIDGRGIPPTMREIGAQFDIRSTNGVDRHLAALEKAGLIKRERGKSHGIRLTSGERPMASIPLLGRVAAGMPVLSPEHREGEIKVDLALFKLRSPQGIFALKVKGDSMMDSHIVDGDSLIVHSQATARDGDIVVAMVDGEATVKRFFLEKNRVRLQPENRTMRPIYVERGELRVLGKVVGVLRKI
jgi:repressor LexA